MSQALTKKDYQRMADMYATQSRNARVAIAGLLRELDEAGRSRAKARAFRKVLISRAVVEARRFVPGEQAR